MEDFTEVIAEDEQCRVVVNDNSDAHTYRVHSESYTCGVQFQRGPVTLNNPVNGVTSENLLAILIDRTWKLNNRFPCRENSLAITKMEEALMWFEKRTANRKARGVEGKEVV